MALHRNEELPLKNSICMSKTPPVNEIIPRKPHEGIQPILDHFADLLEDAVNMGSNILEWDKNPKSTGEENIPPLMLLRHFIDLVDSISVLVRQSCCDPTQILMRAAFEAKISLDFLLEKDSIERANAFIFSDLLRQISTLGKFDSSTDEGKELKKTLAKEGLSSQAKINISIAKNHKKSLENILLQSKFTALLAERDRLKSLKLKIPSWYGFFGGPKNIQELATSLGQRSAYELLYRTWSGSAHASDIYQGKISKMSDGGVGIVQLRNPQNLQLVTHTVLTFALYTFYGYTKARIPHKQKAIAHWHMGIKNVYDDLNKEQLIQIAEE